MESLYRPFRRVGCALAAAELVLCTEDGDQLAKTLSVRRRKKCMIVIALSIVFYQVRKILLEERKKDRGGAGLQEKGIREDVVPASLGSRSYEHFQIPRCVRDAGPYRRTTHAPSQSPP